MLSDVLTRRPRGEDTRTRILTVLTTRCATRQGLVEATGLSREQVRGQVKNLLDKGLIRWHEVRGQHYYYLAIALSEY